MISGLFFAYFVQRQRLRAERQKREMETQRHEFEQLQRVTEQKLTRNYLDKLEYEHARLAKELHDGVCNDLFSMEVSVDSQQGVQTRDWIANLRKSERISVLFLMNCFHLFFRKLPSMRLYPIIWRAFPRRNVRFLLKLSRKMWNGRFCRIQCR